MIHTDGTTTICNAQDDERTPGPAALAAEIPTLREEIEAKLKRDARSKLPSLSVSFGEGSEAAFAHVVRDFSGWNVELTLLDGTKVNAVLVGATRENGWLDDVTYRAVNSETGEPIGSVLTSRVSNVHIY